MLFDNWIITILFYLVLGVCLNLVFSWMWRSLFRDIPRPPVESQPSPSPIQDSGFPFQQSEDHQRFSAHNPAVTLPPRFAPEPELVRRNPNQLIAVAELLGVIALKNREEIDPQATTMIRDNRVIDLKHLQSAFALRPILKLHHKGKNTRENLVVVIRFLLYKDEELLFECSQFQLWERDAIFYPNMLFDLSARKTAKRALGNWRVEVGLSYITADELTDKTPQESRLFLLGLPYVPLASFGWQAVETLEQAPLLDTGERPQATNPQAGQSVRLEDI